MKIVKIICKVISHTLYRDKIISLYGNEINSLQQNINVKFRNAIINPFTFIKKYSTLIIPVNSSIQNTSIKSKRTQEYILKRYIETEQISNLSKEEQKDPEKVFIKCSSDIKKVHKKLVERLKRHQFQDSKTEERRKLASYSLLYLCFIYAGNKTTINPISCALIIHRTASILPLIYSEYKSDWVFKECGIIYKEIIERFMNNIDNATTSSIMMLFWGMGRLGTEFLEISIENEKFPTGKDIYNELLSRLITANEFNGNNICNTIESLSRMKYEQKEEVFNIVLNKAHREFAIEKTSPFNLSYFLEAIVQSDYKIEKSIIEMAIENIAKSLRKDIKNLHLHHVIKAIDASTILKPNNIILLIDALKFRIEKGEMFMKPLWNEDIIKLINAIDKFDLNLNLYGSMIEFCIEMSKRRGLLLIESQEKRFKEALKKLNYDLNGPINK